MEGNEERDEFSKSFVKNYLLKFVFRPKRKSKRNILRQGVCMKKELIMKLTAKVLVIFCACNIATACASKKTQDESKKVQQVKIQDVGGDQTDVFAIPLDTSEEEEDLQMQKLEKIEKRNMDKKTQAGKNMPSKGTAGDTKKAPSAK